MRIPFMTIALASSLAFSSGCAFRMSPVGNSTDLTQVDFSDAAQWKKGESCITFLLGFFPISRSASVYDAAIAGGISKVMVVDEEFKKGFLSRSTCITVYGK